jgi:hypothetical protein
MWVEHNNEGRSCSHCCCVEAISITYSEFVSAALVIQHPKRMRRIVIFGLSGSTVLYTLSH